MRHYATCRHSNDTLTYLDSLSLGITHKQPHTVNKAFVQCISPACPLDNAFMSVTNNKPTHGSSLHASPTTHAADNSSCHHDSHLSHTPCPVPLTTQTCCKLFTIGCVYTKFPSTAIRNRSWFPDSTHAPRNFCSRQTFDQTFPSMSLARYTGTR